MTTTDANLVPELRWTTVAPTLPGWYWWRRKQPDYSPRVLHVSTEGWVVMTDYVRQVDSLGGEWYGPLQVPED